MRLDDLPLSYEIINILNQNALIFYVNDLIKKSDDDLLKIRGIGKIQMNYIRNHCIGLINRHKFNWKKIVCLLRCRSFLKSAA